MVEEDGVQQLYITDVKAGGLAFAKGSLPFISIKWTPWWTDELQLEGKKEKELELY